MTDKAMKLQRAIKRGIDIAGAGTGLVLLSPLLLTTAAAVRVSMGSPVLFRQTRPGLGGEPFEMLKFRTMLPVDEQRGLVDDADRLTPVGKFLRATSLDEFPELINVVRGDMSLVGPRPLLMQYLERYTPRQARRHEVRPGITGLAQTSGRNALSWEDRFELDVQYVENWSLLADAKILVNTVLVVLGRKGIAEAGQATMTEFQGSGSAQSASATA